MLLDGQEHIGEIEESALDDYFEAPPELVDFEPSPSPAPAADASPPGLAHLDPPATMQEARHAATVKRARDCRLATCRVHGKAAKPRELSAQERERLDVDGEIDVGGGKVIRVNRKPYRPWLASTCELCARADAATKANRASGKGGPVRPPPHAHRLDAACIFCGAAKVWARSKLPPDVMCLACGRWWDPEAPPPKEAIGAVA